VTLGEQIIHHYDRQLVDEKHRLGKQETCNFSYGRRFFHQSNLRRRDEARAAFAERAILLLMNSLRTLMDRAVR
jgi:hypothetical protein